MYLNDISNSRSYDAINSSNLNHISHNSTKAEIQLPLKRFPDSLVTVRKGILPPKTRSNTHGWINWPMAILPLVVELTLLKCRHGFGCLPRGKHPTLAQHGRK